MGEVWCNRTGVLGILKKLTFLGPHVIEGCWSWWGTYYGKTLLFERICSLQNPADGETAMQNLRPCSKCGFGGT